MTTLDGSSAATVHPQARDLSTSHGPAAVGASPFVHSANAGSEREKIRTIVVEDHGELARIVAHRIASLIRERNARGAPIVLGLATGSTPIGVYRELIRLHREEGLSFKRVVTFNLDEYYPMRPDSMHSYVRFMWENLFSHVDIDPKNVHMPDGTLARSDVDGACQAYENAIVAAG